MKKLPRSGALDIGGDIYAAVAGNIYDKKAGETSWNEMGQLFSGDIKYLAKGVRLKVTRDL